MRLAMIVTALLALAAEPALAQNIDRREARQERRMEQGVGSGALTRQEAWKIRRAERRIARQERRMRARNGGRLTPQQRARLNARLDRQSRRIRRLKHNDRRYRAHPVCYRRYGVRRCVWR